MKMFIVKKKEIEKVKIEEERELLRIYKESEDDIIGRIIKKERELVEEEKGMEIIEKKWRMRVDRWKS